jgi:hypothetical protein
MGRQVTSDTADTTHVRALKIVAPDGAALGGNGITFLSADGTAGVVTLLDSDELALDGVAIGGGGGAAGLESGTGTDSMQSSSTVTTVAADASGAGAIALGDSAIAGGINNISIGTSNNTNGADIINIGDNNDMSSYSDRSVLIRPGGGTGIAFRGESVTIGDDTYPGAAGVAIGKSARGKNNNPNVAIGKDAEAGNTGIAIGQDADASGNGSAALGAFSIANGVGAIALGSVSATTVDTVTMKLLQILNYATMSFADDAAAATGGIPLGGVYHTAGALKIRIA